MLLQLGLGRHHLSICSALLLTQPGQIRAQRLFTAIEAGRLLIKLPDQPLLPADPPGDLLNISLQIPPLTLRLDQGPLLLAQPAVQRCHPSPRLLFRCAHLIYLGL